MKQLISSFPSFCSLQKLVRTEGISKLAIISNFFGQRSKMLPLLEFDVGLKRSDYRDRARLAMKLQKRLVNVAPNSAAQYVFILAGMLGAEGRRQDGVTLMETDAGLEPSDYNDPELLASKLHRRLKALNPEMAALYAFGLASVLAMNELHAEALAVLEAWVDLKREDYDNPQQLVEKLHTKLHGLQPDLAVSYLMILISLLGIANRGSEIPTIFRADLGLEDGDIDPIQVAASIRNRLNGLTPLGMIPYLTAFFALEDDPLSSQRLAVLEQLVDIKPEDYQDRPQLAAKLRHLDGQTPLEVNTIYVKLLAGVLAFSDRSVHALAVLETYTGINADDYADYTLLMAKLRKRFRNLAAESATTYMRILASVLDSLGRSADAVMLMELDAGLQGVDYSKFKVLHTKLKQRLQTITAGTGAAYVFEMANVLRSAGQLEKEAYLVDCYVMDFAQLKSRPTNNYSIVRHVCPLYDRWLQHFTAADRDITLSVCQQLIPYLRNSFAHQGVRLKDRREFINYVTDLRQRLLAAGYYWASRESDADHAKRLWLVVQLWDAELTQRLLLERFLLDRLDAPVPPTTKPLTAPETSLERAYPKLFGRAQAIAQQGLDEARLAQLLGQNTLLLRATFEQNGRLLWTALISNGHKLSVVTYGRSRHEGDLALLRWAAAKHDLRLELAQLSGMFKTTQQQIRFHLKKAIGSLLEYLDQVGQERAQSQESVPSSQRSLLDVFNEQCEKLRQQERYRVLDMLDTCYGPLKSGPTSSQTYEQWADEGVLQLRQILSFVQAEIPSVANIQTALNAATQEYVTEVSKVWPLDDDDLAKAMTPEMDVVFQVDDALHAVPLAHLSVAGYPLYQRVRSVRNSLSVLVTILQQEAERDFHTLDSNNARMFVISWFRKEEEEAVNRKNVTWLHRGHLALAEHYGLEYYAAAEDPEGSLGAISAVLGQHSPFRIMTVCGHGDRQSVGVKLKDDAGKEGQERLWDGGGLDLSLVEWLLMVSCSIGRLAENGDRDVEGFCVKLALHRALSVLACRWPVDTLEACSFANEIVSQYLGLRQEIKGQRDGTTERLRAKALNEARKRFLGDGSSAAAQPYAGLNTVAAFELYGIG